jgi:hypothetical protein
MKKISGKIAIVLILVMLVSSFTGCLSYWGRGHEPVKRVLYAVVDIVFLPVSLLCLLVYVIVTQETETQSYLANLDNNLLSDCYSLYEKLYSLPEAELASLTLILDSIPEAERNSTMEKIYSLSELKLFSMVKAYDSLPVSDIISSIERIKSLHETELVSLLRTFISLTDAELDSIIESIGSQFEMVNVVSADNFDSSLEIVSVFSVEALETKPVTFSKGLQ